MILFSVQEDYLYVFLNKVDLPTSVLLILFFPNCGFSGVYPYDFCFPHLHVFAIIIRGQIKAYAGAIQETDIKQVEVINGEKSSNY